MSLHYDQTFPTSQEEMATVVQVDGGLTEENATLNKATKKFFWKACKRLRNSLNGTKVVFVTGTKTFIVLTRKGHVLALLIYELADP